MSSLSVWRTVDANLNRAAEGLRVIEDYVRFFRDDRSLAAACKQLRHQLGVVACQFPSRPRLTSRDATNDVGRHITTAQEATRHDPDAVLAANFNRVQQALRSLEEWGKLINVGAAAQLEQIRYDCYTLQSKFERASGAAELHAALLYVLIDEGKSPTDFVERLTAIVSVQVPLVQLRAKRLADRPLWQLAERARSITHGTQTRLIINDRVDLAAAIQADGVHLGQDDLPIEVARSIVGHQMWIGVSTHSLRQAAAGEQAGADYIGVGPTFPSETKSFEDFPGLDFLRTAAAQISTPKFAIGGIGAHNLAEVKSAGIRQIAVSSAVWSAADPARAARDLLEQLQLPTPDNQIS
ncbi:MAG: thiamine phosphate synthase [Planctomycetales bacterium]|nr:thiamine phosphate synthase [Planctomycetales bacterium]